MKQYIDALATALTFFKGYTATKVRFLYGLYPQGLPSLIGGTGLFLFLDEKKQKSRLPNLWLELQIHGAQSEAVPLRYTSTLCSFTIPFTLHSAKFSEAVLAKWLCVVNKLKAEGGMLISGFEKWILKLFINAKAQGFLFFLQNLEQRLKNKDCFTINPLRSPRSPR
jgi:hypothetical protein